MNYYYSSIVIPHVIISRKVTLPHLSLIPIIILSSRPTNYPPASTTSPTILNEVTPPRQQFIPFTVPTPVTPAIPPTEIIFSRFSNKLSN